MPSPHSADDVSTTDAAVGRGTGGKTIGITAVVLERYRIGTSRRRCGWLKAATISTRWAAIAGMTRRITRNRPARRQPRRTFNWT